MFDFDLAELYETETRILKQAVRRNLVRFPSDFMFQLNKEEWQEVITTCDNLPKNSKYNPTTPFAFTEHGVAMLASVLKSEKAIQINILIVRAFIAFRQHLTDFKMLQKQIGTLEDQMDMKFNDVHKALNYLLKEESDRDEQAGRKQIGYKK